MHNLEQAGDYHAGERIARIRQARRNKALEAMGFEAMSQKFGIEDANYTRGNTTTTKRIKERDCLVSGLGIWQYVKTRSNDAIWAIIGQDFQICYDNPDVKTSINGDEANTWSELLRHFKLAVKQAKNTLIPKPLTNAELNEQYQATLARELDPAMD